MQSTHVRGYQGGSLGPSIHRWYTSKLSNGVCGCSQEEEGATPGENTWFGVVGTSALSVNIEMKFASPENAASPFQASGK